MSAEEGDLKRKMVSVIIACYNGAKTIGVQLDALARQQWSGPWEIILADNGSTDDTLQIVGRYKEKLPNLRVVDASARRGKPYALNVGAQVAKGERLLFCDADDEVGEGWLAAMGDALSDYDFVACRFDDEKLNKPWVAEGCPSGQKQELPKLFFAPNIYAAGGGTIGVNRSLLLETAGGFDETLLAQEDTMLCVQLQMAGKEMHFVPEAVLHIRRRDTFWATFRQAYSWSKYLPLLYKKSVALGVPKVAHPWRNAIRGWRNLLGMLRRTRNKATLLTCMFRLGWQLGLVWGSIKDRVLFL